MPSNIDVTFYAKWKDAGDWSGALDIEMVNITGSISLAWDASSDDVGVEPVVSLTQAEMT